MLTFWRRVIEKYAAETQKIVFTIAELQQVFKIPTKSGNYFPLGLDVVLVFSSLP
jgi:hypothetical protein